MKRKQADGIITPGATAEKITGLLDRFDAGARESGRDPASLVKVLEGGSWAAGREIAAERRPDGSAPLAIVSDGTLF